MTPAEWADVEACLVDHGRAHLYDEIHEIRKERDAAIQRAEKAERERDDLRAKLAAPIAMVITCPLCRKQHNDEGEWRSRPHKTHRCVADAFGLGCGHEWRPSNVATVGVKYEVLAAAKGGG